ncbi:MAG: glycosyltransferase family 4 protein [Candidatus Hodarchaeota archaeon]
MTQHFNPLNICIVSHLAYGAMKGGSSGHAGGVEHQTSLMARWLAARGHRVTLLTWDEGINEEETIEGVHIIKMCRQNEGLPVVRFFYPRWTSLIRAMKMADAELYYHNCAEYVTGQVARWCKSHGQRFIYSVASDADCELKSPELKKLHDRLFFRYGLRRAAQIIVQTRKQQRLLLDNYGLSSIILPMPCQVPVNNKNPKKHLPNNGNPRIVWVGRIDRVKRLELLLDIAEAIPDIVFDIAGKPTYPEDPYCQNLLARAEKMANVNMQGMVPQNRMRDLYQCASLLCNTSLYEGFPNTFLEAWSYGIPVVSTFDPDKLLTDKKLGIYAENKSEIISGIKILLEDKPLWQKMSANARQYFEDNHSLDQAMEKFEKVFNKVRNST